MPLQSTRSSLERRRDREAAMTALNLCISSAIVSLNCSSSSWEYHVLSVSALLSLRKRKSWLVVAKLTERVWVVIVDYYAFVLSVGVIAFGFCTPLYNAFHGLREGTSLSLDGLDLTRLDAQKLPGQQLLSSRRKVMTLSAGNLLWQHEGKPLLRDSTGRSSEQD